MTTVRDAALELLRAHGMTTIFGNPGSTELPMLGELPDDFHYVLGLQELAVVGIADGYAQASGRPAHVNLHTAPGVGNAIGGIFNAQANRAPLLVTAGQQHRAQVTIEANLTNRDAILGPMPHVKYSHEPARAQDVPTALARAIAHTMLPPRGPAFVSIPMDDWAAKADPDRSRHAVARTVHGRVAPDPEALAEVAARLDRAAAPVLVAGPGIDAVGARAAAVALAERLRLPVWAPPVTGGSRLGFPEDHPQFRGTLPPAIGPLGETLAGHDLFVGGSQQVPLRLAAALGHRVVLRSPVRSIEQTATGVRVVSDRGTIAAGRVVVAIPPALAGRIAYGPALPFERDQLTQRFGQGTLTKVAAVYDRPFWRDAGLTGALVSTGAPVSVSYDDSPTDGRIGIVAGFVGADNARRYAGMAAADRRRAVLAQFEHAFQSSRARRPTAFLETSWAGEEWSRGCPVGIPAVGSFVSYGPRLREPVGRIHWAGTETATYWNGYMDGAISSGQRVADEVRAAL